MSKEDKILLCFMLLIISAVFAVVYVSEQEREECRNAGGLPNRGGLCLSPELFIKVPK